jgi:3-hydroxyacyl-CoA dehydrogenase/enoyl-CoA hydratase/3-hydroxybutyryl-CoA epimerase
MKLKTIQYGIQDGIAVITFDEENSPVNTMCLQWQDDLDAVAAQVAKDKDAIRGIILASAKSTFFAGADLKGVMRMQPEDATRVYVEIERIKKNFRIIETLGKPVVSCLNGTALGGGWEVALVGHHRIAVNNPKTQFGLPEVTLGLIPGGGGITKMTRQLGLMAAQPYLLESKLFGPAEAQKLGFVHALVDSDAELMPAARPGSIRCRAMPRPASIPGTARATRCPAARPPARPSRRAWSWRPPCSKRPRAACTRPRKPRCARWSKARRWTSIPRCASRAATWPV